MLLLLNLLSDGASALPARRSDLARDALALVVGELTVQIRAFPWRRRTRAYAASLLLVTKAALLRQLRPHRTRTFPNAGEVLVDPTDPAGVADLLDVAVDDADTAPCGRDQGPFGDDHQGARAELHPGAAAVRAAKHGWLADRFGDPGAWLGQWRLMAIDGVRLNIAETPENVAVYEKCDGGRLGLGRDRGGVRAVHQAAHRAARRHQPGPGPRAFTCSPGMPSPCFRYRAPPSRRRRP